MGNNMTTAEHLKKLRRTLCPSQYELAVELQITASSLSLYESGKRTPGYITIRKILSLAKKNNISLTIDDIKPE